MSVTCEGSSPWLRSIVWVKTPYSSAVCSRRVVSRHEATSRASSYTPSLTLVLPTSTASSISAVPAAAPWRWPSGGTTRYVSCPSSRRTTSSPPGPRSSVVPSPPGTADATAEDAAPAPRGSHRLEALLEQDAVPAGEAGEHRRQGRLARDLGAQAGERGGRARETGGPVGLLLRDVHADADDDERRDAGHSLGQDAGQLPLPDEHVVRPLERRRDRGHGLHGLGHRAARRERDLPPARHRERWAEHDREQQRGAVGSHPRTRVLASSGGLVVGEDHRALGRSLGGPGAREGLGRREGAVRPERPGQPPARQAGGERACQLDVERRLSARPGHRGAPGPRGASRGARAAPLPSPLRGRRPPPGRAGGSPRARAWPRCGRGPPRRGGARG